MLLFFSSGNFFDKYMIKFENQWMANSFSHVQAFLVLSTDEGRSAICHLPSASSPPASSARWSRPRPQCGCRAAWRVGSKGRRGRPAKPLTPVSFAPLSTWNDQMIWDAKKWLNKIFFSIPCLLFLCFASSRILRISDDPLRYLI